MASKLEDYIAQGKALDADEREIAALALQRVDEAEQAEVDADWDTEINRRVDEVVNGEVALVDGEETLASIHQMIAARRGA
ncbi:MAG: addiction module protein [Propionibacteriales bacterium]|nr:addiction module protein [Propionibacteriales bacterium]